MPTDTAELRLYLWDFDFTRLFVEGLGWNYHAAEPVTVKVDGRDYSLKPVAEKKGFVVYQCDSSVDNDIPLYPVRRKIERAVAKRAFEHLIVFVDPERRAQIWQWVKRERGKPVACREYAVHAGQSGDHVLQRLQRLAFDIEEESGLTVPVVTSRVQAALDVETVTKRFYERFRTELTAFGEFIDGITAEGDRDWYASLMLNRMMFVYFVQKQGFLDDDRDYLRNRLKRVQNQGGERFQQFYRIFLLRLFHEGLGMPEAQRAPDLAALLGKVPFLNGGLFDVHDLERDHPKISIPDDAFERVFDFFDGYRWHLDERPDREDNEINPDVLGYIFEKYVNQKQMGAYYTKEDITGYIGRNTVIPFLFDAAKKQCPVAFGPDGGVWRLLRENPDRYIYPAVGHGVAWNWHGQDGEPQILDAPLDPADAITTDIDDPSHRSRWNSAAPEKYALPTETWHEVIARRQRYDALRAKLVAGQVREVNDLITLNLDIEQFTKDVIVQSEGPELLRAFWLAMRDISVLDPTCGSGAFLFAALNILEPLYAACLEGMRGFLDDLELTERHSSPGALSDFTDVLTQMEKHASERYFVLKSIVLNNLYGVDVMEEAVEICKLRLFLKLVAQLERYEQIEPLPDIDFNIRAGNALVGFTSLDAVRHAMTVTPDGQHRALFDQDRVTLARIEKEAALASAAFTSFREQQTVGGGATTDDKAELRRRLEKLSDELDRHLATEYGVNTGRAAAYDAWRVSHQPFHWLVEFYEIMSKGGFDVVIGNPPYVSRRKVAESYTLRGFRTADCPDVYATVVERTVNVCRANGRTSMIVPLSLTFSSGFASLRTHLYEECGSIWFSSFGRIPSALFSFDTRVRNAIYLGHNRPSKSCAAFTTRLHRWFDSQRPALFECLSYSSFSPTAFGGLVPKIGSARLIQGFESLLTDGSYRLRNEFSLGQRHSLHFKQTAYNWLTFCVDEPPVYGPNNNILSQTQYGTVYIRSRDDRDLLILLANGKLAFVWWLAVGDDFHVTQTNFASAPFGPRQLTVQQRKYLLALLPQLRAAMAENLVFKLNAGKNVGNYNLARCRHVTDKSDKIWLEAVGVSDLWNEIELEYSLVVRTSF